VKNKTKETKKNDAKRYKSDLAKALKSLNAKHAEESELLKE